MKLPTLEEFFVAHGILTRQPRVVRPFHRRIFQSVTQWVAGTLPGGARNLAICIPPRHGKTYIARDLVSWGLMCFPDSEWIYTASSATLAIAQTLAIKECCASDWYRRIAPYVGVQSGKGRQDYFRTTAGGAVYGVGAEGALTGFGAGKKRPEFGGGILIDDPIQALDALTVRREKCNLWYSQALYSRRNAAHTPILLIMQRLHEKDLVGYVRATEGGQWHILSIPVVDDDGAMLWPETFDHGAMERLKTLDPFAFSAQYMQAPTPPGGAMIKTGWIRRFGSRPAGITSVGIFADTAQKTGQHNDFTVFILAGTDGRNVYILDLLRDRLEAPDLISAAKAFYERHRPNRITNPVRFAGFFVEDKVSGTGLIQTLRRETNIPVIPIQRDRDKVSRVNDVLPYIRAGRLFVPEDEPWVNAYIGELAAFSPAMTHEHDDQVDPTCDALSELLSPGGNLITGADWS